MKIEFHGIRVKNFGSVGNQFIEIQLDRKPTTLVYGANGTAKSFTMIDSISFVLFGKPFRNINKGQLINSINMKECLVECDFSVGSVKYLVRRGMRPDVFEIYRDGKLIQALAGRKDHQDYLEKNILKMNHKSFFQIVVLGSATFVPFMQLSAGARREIIEDLLDLQVFSQMNTLLKNRRDQNKQDIADLRYESEVIEEKVRLQKQYIESLKQNNAELIDELEEKNIEYEAERIEYLSLLEVQSEEVKELNASLEDVNLFKKKQSQYDKFESQIEGRKEKLEKDSKFFSENDNCPTCKQPIDHDFKCEKIADNTEKLREIADGLLKLELEQQLVQNKIKAIQDIQNRISQAQRKISDCQSSIANISRAMDTTSRQIATIKERGKASKEDTANLKKLEKDRKNLDKKREDLIKQKAVYDVAQVLLKEGGIKTKIIKQYIPIINVAINKFLGVLDLFVQFELDETFKETIKSRHREEFSYASFSEGEKMRINLAITFAWREIARMRNSNNTNLMILDEVGDSSLDGEGLDSIIGILKEMGDSGTHVFVVSHRENLLEKFDGSIRFVKHKNFSTIEQN